MGIIVSPGVYTTERDFSLYVPELATSVYGIVTTASRGPLDEVTLITDEGSLIKQFGPPYYNDTYHYGLFAAQRYLRFGRQLKVVRVGTYATQVTDQTVLHQAAGSTALTVAVPDDVGYGTWANSISFKVEQGTDYTALAPTYKITVRWGTYTVEVFDRLVLGSANAADNNYIETRINGVSEYISVTDAETYTTLLATDPDTPTWYTFSGGADGAPADDSDVIGVAGSPPLSTPTGLQCFADGESVDVNILGVPGRGDRTIVAALETLCETRGDCLGLVDIPSGKTVQQAVAWSNGSGGGLTDPTASLNSSYLALYYPWVTVYDSWSDAEVAIPPQGHVAGVMAYTDFTTEPWYAPAGLNRALLADVLSVEHSATQGERDYMYGSDNVVNPICDYQGQGYTIWGQKTAQRAPSSLDRINVRRMMLYLRKIIATAVRYLIFEPNDRFTWEQFKILVRPTLRAIRARRGLYDFRVVCDDTTNTSDVIAKNEMRARILLQPTKTAEMISVEFTLLPTGVSFDEFPVG